jgi:hypothetical protein
MTRQTDAQAAAEEHEARRIEAQLDAALEDSFPASDPVSFVTSQTEEYWRAEDTGPDKSEKAAHKSDKASDRS